MNKTKKLYSFVFALVVFVFASLAVLGSVLGDNVGKDPNAILVSLPSIYSKNKENDLEQWDYVSEMTLFGSNYGENRDKVIAPGMSNSVEIVIDNRNSDALDYEINFSFFSSEEDFWIPLKCKITRYDGTLITDDYTSVENLNYLTDTHTLGGERHAYYLVEWYWPDDIDNTYIGNMALEKDLKISATINATSKKSEDKESTNGISTEYKQDSGWQSVNTVIGAIILIQVILTCLSVYRLNDEFLIE